ncbi:PREDICTED: uncharacterized protein C22orf15 homolog isoform X1 [Galeopterus variegatus]|uniref:Uncharacterized protein C22orf15 homolog isoform X1 n=1 Tax=Galeopterus variegatus TaxID=482537 RepID=A0ABM0QEJ5_GALVR|nr:PREDICTED: uncharacterized protein C22orf15 homolog isoform X1 [Galeopterus variegatus]
MFITVLFGAGCWELVNPRCSLVTLTAHLRQRGRVPSDATIALLAEDGHLVSLGEGLEEGTSPASSMGSPLLQERRTYVLVQIITGFSGPSRGVTLAVRPPHNWQQLETAHGHSAWPPGARPPFKTPKDGLLAAQVPGEASHTTVRHPSISPTPLEQPGCSWQAGQLEGTRQAVV